jgi:hypothetical protein
MQSFQKDGIIHRIIQLDNDLLALYGMTRRFEIILVGGSALVLLDLLSDERFTTDIDVLETSNEIIPLLERYDMNLDVSTFIYKYPENWRERLQPIEYEDKVLDVYTLSNEDLAITKLLAWRRTDQTDLVNMLAAGSIDVGKLKNIINDITEICVNLDDEEWTALQNRIDNLLSGELE